MSALVLLALACGSQQGADSAAAQDTAVTGSLAQAMPWEPAASCAECHPRQYEEWRQSMHAYAARSPIFDAMAAKAYRDSAGELGTFCTGCHSPYGDYQGLSGATVAADRDAMALEAISCDYCHTAVDHDAFVGNNQLLTDPGGPKQGPFGSDSTDGHRSVDSDFLRSPELCGSCHDVYKYPGLQVEQAYTEFLESPAHDEGLRCQDCHMSPVPGLPAERPSGPVAVIEGQSYPDREQASHRFVGPDYSILDDFPYAGDPEASAAAREEYLEQVQVLLENGVGLADLQASRDGGQLTVQVSLENRTSGHRVPTGFTSERQLWIELTVRDRDGVVFFRSGDLDADGNLRDSHSPLVQAGEVEEDPFLVNLQSRNVVVVRDYAANGSLTQEEGSRAEYETIFPFDADFIDRRSLEPLETRSWQYQISDDGHPGPFTVQALLHYRNLPPYVLQALQLDDQLDRLQLFTLGSAELEIP